MKLTLIKIVYILELLIVLLIAFGLIPREAGLFLLGVLIFYLIFQPLEDGVILFIASIPIFIALPITERFDSLSSARIIILILFIKWFLINKKQIWEYFKSLNFKKILKNHRLELLALLLFVIMALSIMYAVDVVSAIKKIIYLLNLIIIFPVIKSIIKNERKLKRTIRAVLISGGVVFLIALGQLISVYFFTIGNFWDWWADHFSLGFYGENLRQIVKNMNVWFAYSPVGPSVIRLFGSFTDPHSFALYLLLIVPFIIYLSFSRIKEKLRGWSVWLILVLFFIVLSGTRGIWFSVVFAVIGAIYLLIRKLNLSKVISFILLILIIFIALIPISSVFTVIPQFREAGIQDTDVALLLKRLASVLDLSETSNQGRIYIWKKSLESLKNNFLLGVGVGNFPVVLEQEIKLAKAGSSAHNLYLNFAVESGVFALIIIVLIILEILATIVFILKLDLSEKLKALITGIFIFLIWIFGYSLFDIALLDERVFLLFLIVIGIIYGIKTGFNNYSNL